MRNLLNKIDWTIFGASLFLTVISATVLSSISYELFTKQLIFVGIGLFVFFIMAFIDIRPFVGNKIPIIAMYVGSLLLLLSVVFFGVEVGGNKSWIDLGFSRLQPSEFAKVSLIAVLALFLNKRHIGIRRMDIILKSLFYFAIPAMFIIMEPDLGSVLILFSIWFGFLVFSGLPFRYILASFAIFGVIGLGAWNFVLKDYQKDRIVAVFNPEKDPLGINYNVIQSKNAIGSGGLLGKGYGQGEVVQLGFLPSAPTDFIFSALVEEWGFLGGMMVIITYSILVIKIAFIGMKTSGNFYKFICLGTAIFLVCQFMVNIGSAIGLFPVVGVVFPLLSYGGSNILVTFILLSLVNNVSTRKYNT